MNTSVSLKEKLSIHSIKAAIETRLPNSAYNMLFRRRFSTNAVVDLRKIETFEFEAFPESENIPWLDRKDAPQLIDDQLRSGRITVEQADSFRQWNNEGYLILNEYIDPSRLDAIWAAYESAIEQGRVILPEEEQGADDPYPARALSPHEQVPEIASLLHDPGICSWVRNLSGREPVPYQTIASFTGSEQAVHSDSVHMSTYPVGYMIAAWIAFEDIHEDSGPVVYYPGSHTLPYVSSRSVGITEKKSDYVAYKEKYEPAIRDIIEQNQLKPKYLTAKKGDVLLWHANVLHGGSPRKNIQLSRKAVVSHYFTQGAVSYHDLTGKQTFLDSNRVL